jgi:hypothetical protein
MPRSRKPAPSKAALHPAIPIAQTAVPEHLHQTARVCPAPHPDHADALVAHLQRKHAATLKRTHADDADVIFGDDHPLLVQVRSGKVARILTRA